MDPRVTTSPTGLVQKFELELKLASAITESSKAVMQARSAQEQLEKLAASGETKSAAEDMTNKISNLLDGPKEANTANPQPTLKGANGDVIALYKEVEKADSEPTLAQEKAASKTTSDLPPLLKRWEELKSDLLRLNIRLSAADLQRIDLDRPPEHEEVGENEE